MMLISADLLLEQNANPGSQCPHEIINSPKKALIRINNQIVPIKRPSKLPKNPNGGVFPNRIPKRLPINKVFFHTPRHAKLHNLNLLVPPIMKVPFLKRPAQKLQI